MNTTLYYLGFSQIPAVGPVRLNHLKQVFGSLEAAWNAGRQDLSAAGLTPAAIDTLFKLRASNELARQYQVLLDAGIKIITLEDDAYPENLRRTGQAPALLYMKGDRLPHDDRALAIVGTRKATKYGLDAAYKLAFDLAQAGVTIVSGLAQGIDAAAHRGALDAKGRTIAVLGSGINKIYPTANEALAREVIENGALLSEFGVNTPPVASNFPIRNRIISGLSLGVLIAEAPEQSGALITADAALEQGRDVFAIPSNIFNPSGMGCNRLIQDGAKLITSAEDILNELEITYEHTVTSIQTETIAPENEQEQIIVELLSADAIHVDDIIRTTGLPAEVVTYTLTILELKGLAQSAGAMQYCRAR